MACWEAHFPLDFLLLLHQGKSKEERNKILYALHELQAKSKEIIAGGRLEEHYNFCLNQRFLYDYNEGHDWVGCWVLGVFLT